METAEAARTRPSDPSEDVGEISRCAFRLAGAFQTDRTLTRVLASFPSLCGPPTRTPEGHAHAPRRARRYHRRTSPGTRGILCARRRVSQPRRESGFGRVFPPVSAFDWRRRRTNPVCLPWAEKKSPPKLGPEAQPFPGLQSYTRGSRGCAPAFPRGKNGLPAISAFRSGLAPASARGGPASVISARRVADFFEISEGRGTASGAARESRRAR